MSKCIITGCALKLPNGPCLWGDLFEESNCFIFHTIVDKLDRAQEITPDPQLRMLVVNTTGYFAKKGIFVVSKSTSRLNDVAKAYLEGAPS